MRAIALVICALSCLGNARRVQVENSKMPAGTHDQRKSLASMLQTLNPSAAFNPAAPKVNLNAAERRLAVNALAALGTMSLAMPAMATSGADYYMRADEIPELYDGAPTSTKFIFGIGGNPALNPYIENDKAYYAVPVDWWLSPRFIVSVVTITLFFLIPVNLGNIYNWIYDRQNNDENGYLREDKKEWID